MTTQCKICANSQGNEIFIVREMMFGTRENFTYFRCSSCGCLQITEPPKEISKYYPRESYYSYQETEHINDWRRRIKNKIRDIYINTKYTFLLKKWPSFRTLDDLEWLRMLIRQKAIKKKSAILDIGCGTGYLLQKMNGLGFNNLTGIDPFIEKDIIYPSGLKILKQYIFNITGMYDLIMLHHSFEHMDNPHQVLKQLYNILAPEGFLLIRIPVADSFAWRKYGVNWFQIDAPRHFFLYTKRSMTILGKEAGFALKEIISDSTYELFVNSERYCRDIALSEEFNFPATYIKNCKKQAKELNQILDGDQACFLFKKEG